MFLTPYYNDYLHRFRLKSDIINYKQITLPNNYPNSPKYFTICARSKGTLKGIYPLKYTWPPTQLCILHQYLFTCNTPEENYNPTNKSCLKIYGGMPRIMASIRIPMWKGWTFCTSYKVCFVTCIWLWLLSHNLLWLYQHVFLQYYMVEMNEQD